MTVNERGIEGLTRDYSFDIEILSQRLIDVSRCLLNRPDTKELNLGYIGASKGTAATLIAARELKDVVKKQLFLREDGLTLLMIP